MERGYPNFESGALVAPTSCIFLARWVALPVFSGENFEQSRLPRIDKLVAVITLPRSKRVKITEGVHDAAGPVGNGITRSAQGYVG